MQHQRIREAWINIPEPSEMIKISVDAARMVAGIMDGSAEGAILRWLDGAYIVGHPFDGSDVFVVRGYRNDTRAILGFKPRPAFDTLMCVKDVWRDIIKNSTYEEHKFLERILLRLVEQYCNLDAVCVNVCSQEMMPRFIICENPK